MASTSLGNPPVMAYLLSSRDAAATNRANFTGYFAVTLVALIAMMAVAGLIDGKALLTAAVVAARVHGRRLDRIAALPPVKRGALPPRRPRPPPLRRAIRVAAVKHRPCQAPSPNSVASAVRYTGQASPYAHHPSLRPPRASATRPPGALSSIQAARRCRRCPISEALEAMLAALVEEQSRRNPRTAGPSAMPGRRHRCLAPLPPPLDPAFIHPALQPVLRTCGFLQS